MSTFALDLRPMDSRSASRCRGRRSRMSYRRSSRWSQCEGRGSDDDKPWMLVATGSSLWPSQLAEISPDSGDDQTALFPGRCPISASVRL